MVPATAVLQEIMYLITGKIMYRKTSVLRNHDTELKEKYTDGMGIQL